MIGSLEHGSAWYLGLPTRLNPVEAAAAEVGEGGPMKIYRTGNSFVLDQLPAQGTPTRTTPVRVAPAVDAGADLVKWDEASGLATAVKVGPVTVSLDNHIVIEYAINAGLLTAIPDGPDGTVVVEFDGPDAFRVRATATPTARTAEIGGAQRVLYGWFLGMPLVHNVEVPDYYGGTAPSEPDPTLAGMRTYLTATVDDRAPSSPQRDGVPTKDGPKTLQSHQNTTEAHPGSGPVNVFGFFVVRGPKGTDTTVKVMPPLANSMPSEPLAYQLKLADRWVGLNNHLVIEYGVATGLLALVPLEYGGQMTTYFPDQTQLAVEVESTGVVELGELTRLTVGTMSIKNDDLKLAGNRENSAVAPHARRIVVSCERLAFAPAEIRVRVGENVAVELNAADVMHTFVVDEVDAFVFADAGETGVGGFRPDQPGTYEYYCSLMAHRAAGMTGRLVVEE